MGVFPTVGVQLIRRAVAELTGPFRGGLEPPFPLSQLDGMDIWSESRLAEVGIEDVQHLATANLIDVILGARIPTQRIVDWVDQGLLLLRTGLPRTDNTSSPPTTYAYLRALGVRTSTDLLEAVGRLGLDLRPGRPSRRLTRDLALRRAGSTAGHEGHTEPRVVGDRSVAHAHGAG